VIDFTIVCIVARIIARDARARDGMPACKWLADFPCGKREHFRQRQDSAQCCIASQRARYSLFPSW